MWEVAAFQKSQIKQQVTGRVDRALDRGRAAGRENVVPKMLQQGRGLLLTWSHQENTLLYFTDTVRPNLRECANI